MATEHPLRKAMESQNRFQREQMIPKAESGSFSIVTDGF
ncbi:hypothetical protein SynMITS9220_00865 [Synechococcus sp. MIT S9220]|nr:hypothetical protein SynMITS9220_00865 [Synechococcus sp. MIT S9220]